jgi:predicted acylesterase/phospholipase RssA
MSASPDAPDKGQVEQPSSDGDDSVTNLYEAELAMSEAGSLTELRAARTSFKGNHELHRRFGEEAERLLDHRMHERERQLRQQDRNRVANLLSSAPFHALSNATSPMLVEHGPHINPRPPARVPDFGDVTSGSDAAPESRRTAPLPFDGHEWASYLETLAPLLKPFGTHFEGLTETLAKTLRKAIASMDDGTWSPIRATGQQQQQQQRAKSPVPHASDPALDTGVAVDGPRRYVAIVGRRGVGRGAVFQALTGAGAITASEAVGSKMLPISLTHEDAATVPYMPLHQVRRVWIPLRATVEDLREKPPMREFLADSCVQKTHGRLQAGHAVSRATGNGNSDSPDEQSFFDASRSCAHDGGRVEGKELTNLIRYAHGALLALAAMNRADKLLYDLFWGTAATGAIRDGSSAGSFDPSRDGPLAGPPEIRCRFPWLRGSHVSLALLDVPTPDDASSFLPKTTESLLHRSITTIVVEEAIQSAVAAAAPEASPALGGSMVSAGSVDRFPQWQKVPKSPNEMSASANSASRGDSKSIQHAALSPTPPSSAAPSAASRSGFVDPQRTLQWSPAMQQAASKQDFPSQATPASDTQSGQDNLWKLLRKYAKARYEEQVVAARAAYEELAVWDADAPPAILLALTLPSDSSAQTVTKTSFAQMAIACHIRLRRDFKLDINITNMFIVSPVAAGAVVRLFDAVKDLVTENILDDGVSPTLPVTTTPSARPTTDSSAADSAQTSQTAGDSDVNSVLSQLSKSGLLEPWRACLRHDATAASQQPRDLSELLGQNEVVWRMSAFGWLISALLQNVIANHVIPAAVIRLVRVQRSVDGLVHCLVEALVQNDVYASAKLAPMETMFVANVRAAVSPLAGLLKEQLIIVEDAMHKWEEETPKRESGRDGSTVATPNPEQAKAAGAAGAGFFAGAINAAYDQANELKESAEQRVHKTRLSLANAIRMKIAAVNAIRPPPRPQASDDADGSASKPTTSVAPAETSKAPTIAVSAVDAIAKRAASVLQGTSPDVGTVSEVVRAWWHQLSDSQRLGEGDANSLTFRTVGNETALRLAFGVPELAEHFADDTSVLGNPTLATISNALRHLHTNPMMRASLSSKTAQVSRVMVWNKVAPPTPSAVIKHLVTEHTTANATAPAKTTKNRPAFLLQVEDVDFQSHRELHRNLLSAGRYAKEALAVTTAYESALENLAGASLIERFGKLGFEQIALPSSTIKGKKISPVALAFNAFQALSAAVHGALAAHYHMLSATLLRSDDVVAHLGLESSDEDVATPAILHCVARLHESHAEWRRWRVAMHRECAIAAAETVDLTFPIVTKDVDQSLWPPPTCQVDTSAATQPKSTGSSGSKSRGLDTLESAHSAWSTKIGTHALPHVVTGSHPGSAARVKGGKSKPSFIPRGPGSLTGRKKAVLCLCGGGVRGVLTALFVQRLDTIIQAKYSVPGRKRVRIWDVVDEIYGTSTGAIVAALLCIGIEPSAIVNLYKNHSNQIFPQSSFNRVTAAAQPKYDPAGRLDIARRYMGRRVMNDETVYTGIARPKILMCDLSTLKTRVLTQEDDVPFVDALMAATAAPTFFPAVKIGATYYCDGGIAENHPGLEVAKDMRAVGYVATVGTGVGATNFQHLHNAGLVHWAPCFADVFIDSSQSVADEVLKAIFGHRSELLNVTLPPTKMALDDVTTIPKLVELAHTYMHENTKTFEKVADGLFSAVNPNDSLAHQFRHDDDDDDADEDSAADGNAQADDDDDDDVPETPFR